jgi:hypothetical protein
MWIWLLGHPILGVDESEILVLELSSIQEGEILVFRKGGQFCQIRICLLSKYDHF